MRPPAFWQKPAQHPGALARLLAPLAAIYALATARRVARATRYRAAVPVICIGNLNVGGTGKTPTTIALAARLAAAGHSPHIISRGYGGALRGPLRVIETKHSAADVGDEPLLLAAFAATWIARDRVAAARAAEAAGADVILMDDGFQNSALHRDLSIVVVDAARGFGNGRVLPAGPLREPVRVGLRRAELVLSVGDDDAQTGFRQIWGDQIRCPQLSGALQVLTTGMEWNGVRLLAFAGIGHPEKFFATLRGLGADLVRTEALDDHQPLSATLMKRLRADADALNAQLVTTEKDAVRLPHDQRHTVLSLPVRLHVDDWTPIDQALARLKLGGKPSA